MKTPLAMVWKIAACLILFCAGGLAQPLCGQGDSLFSIRGKSIVELRRASLQAGSDMPRFGEGLVGSYPSLAFSRNKSEALFALDSGLSGQSFSVKDLAFFCRLEFKMEKAVRFPIKIRLGEVQYVEQLEGKLKRD